MIQVLRTIGFFVVVGLPVFCLIVVATMLKDMDVAEPFLSWLLISIIAILVATRWLRFW